MAHAQASPPTTRPRKKAYAQASPPTTRPLLLHHFPIVHASLFELLAPRDFVVLLSSCRALRSDVGVAAYALQNNAVTSHFGQRCTLDCRSSLVALLSLVGLMTTQLKAVLYSDNEGYVDHWQVVPFIIPTHLEGEVTPSELCGVLEAFKPGLGTAFASAESFLSQPGFHWDNLEVQADTGDVSCAFCEVVYREVVQFQETGHAYWEHRHGAWEQLEDECRNAGYYYDTAEFRARKEAFLEQMGVTDTFYDNSLLDEDFSTVMQSLLRRDRLPLLRLMEPMTDAVEDEVYHAAAEGYTEQICPQVYRPLRKFFSTNGFQHVRRLQASPYSDDEMRDNELINGEMVGGLTPHGFFAGVYFVQYMI